MIHAVLQNARLQADVPAPSGADQATPGSVRACSLSQPMLVRSRWRSGSMFRLSLNSCAKSRIHWSISYVSGCCGADAAAASDACRTRPSSHGSLAAGLGPGCWRCKAPSLPSFTHARGSKHVLRPEACLAGSYDRPPGRHLPSLLACTWMLCALWLREASGRTKLQGQMRAFFWAAACCCAWICRRIWLTCASMNSSSCGGLGTSSCACTRNTQPDAHA